MNFILYIKCTDPNDFSYKDPIKSLFPILPPNTDILDLDDQSDTYLIEQAIQGLSKAEKACVFFDLLPDSKMGPYVALANHLLDHSDRYKVFRNGKNSIMEKLLFPKAEFIYHDLNQEQQRAITTQFLIEK